MTDKVKKSLTKVVVSEILASGRKKSSGTKIATKNRVIPIITVKPFSL